MALKRPMGIWPMLTEAQRAIFTTVMLAEPVKMDELYAAYNGPPRNRRDNQHMAGWKANQRMLAREAVAKGAIKLVELDVLVRTKEGYTLGTAGQRLAKQVERWMKQEEEKAKA